MRPIAQAKTSTTGAESGVKRSNTAVDSKKPIVTVTASSTSGRGLTLPRNASSCEIRQARTTAGRFAGHMVLVFAYHYRVLEQKRVEIERLMGTNLEWRGLPQYHESQVRLTRKDVDPADEST